jgi:anti-sigma factor RsiW
MACHRISQIHAYHDGELDATRRAVVEAHLERCAECRRLLDELHELAGLIGDAEVGEASVEAMARFEGAWEEVRGDRGVMRIGAWLSGVAAALLVGALLTVPRGAGVTRVKPELWEAMAVTPPAESQAEGNSDLVQVAQWMADDLSAGGRR